MSTSNYLMVGDLHADSHLATCGPSLAKDKKAPTPIPTYVTAQGAIMYLPGAGLRSKLRGALTELTLEALEQRGARRFGLKDAQFNRVGGIKQGGADLAKGALERQAMIRANPILGLFGASTPWVKGAAMVGHVSCRSAAITPMHVEGVRSDIFRREPGMMEHLDDSAVEDYNNEIARTKKYSDIKKKIESLNKTAKSRDKSISSEARTKATAQIKALETEVETNRLMTVAAQQPLQGYIAIPPGAALDNKISLVGATEIELGAMVAAIERFSRAPVLGAHGAHGAGVISGVWQVSKTGVGSIGTLRVEPFIGLTIDGEALQAAKKVFEAFVRTDECQPYAPDEGDQLSGLEAEGDTE